MQNSSKMRPRTSVSWRLMHLPFLLQSEGIEIPKGINPQQGREWNRDLPKNERLQHVSGRREVAESQLADERERKVTTQHQSGEVGGPLGVRVIRFLGGRCESRNGSGEGEGDALLKVCLLNNLLVHLTHGRLRQNVERRRKHSESRQDGSFYVKRNRCLNTIQCCSGD